MAAEESFIDPSEPTRPSSNSLDGPIAHTLPFPVVGVGASAGGMEAFAQLAQNLPRDPGMAFILVMHLDPHHESQAAGILARTTPMPVHEAADGMAVEKDHVYVIPPNTILVLTDGHIALRPRPAGAGQHMPIDYLFRSMAAVHGGKAIGVVLSGGGTDGTLGIQEISAAEGITFAQDEHSAKHDSMPRSAISAGCIDFVLPPPEIARELLRIARHPYANGHKVVTETAPEESDQLNQVFSLLRTSAGVDFSQYKRSTVQRRIGRRMALHNRDAMDDYLKLLREDPEEVRSLYQDLLIQVTSFFRDPDAFEALKNVVFPRLMLNRSPDMPVRIWVAGCATGEEVYSIAIALLEFLGDRANGTPIKILATDISDRTLDKARDGVYIENIEADVAPERLRRFFVRLNGHYQIAKSIRDLCVFARHNLVRDPPFSRIDLLSCRNVLIYLSLAMQKRIMPLFHYALRPGGHLLLGSAETVGSFHELFTTVDEHNKIFLRRPAPPMTLPVDFDLTSGHGERRALPAGDADRAIWTPIDLQREVDRVVLARYGPAGVVVDEDLNILHFRGQTSPFMDPSPGAASLNLLKMIRQDLVVELREILAQARAEKVTVRKEGVVVRDGDELRSLNIEVVPLRGPPSIAHGYLVLFEEVPAPAQASASSVALPPDGALNATEERLAQLHAELDSTREYLQSIIEEHETTNEELQSAHEELLSNNEELQSTNEELQTTKEEMQSANEELVTVNDELRHRNKALGKLNNDLVNLFTGVNLPIVMVSRDLRIRRITPLAEKVFNLIPTDIGRVISDIRPNLNLPDLSRHIAEVVETLTIQDVECTDRDGRWYSVHIRPYITLDNHIDGASLVAVDIDVLKQTLTKVQLARDSADAIINAVSQPLVVLDSELRIQRANTPFFERFGLRPEETLQQHFFRVGHGQWDQLALRTRLGEILGQDTSFQDVELQGEFPGIGRRDLVLHGRKIAWQDAGATMILLVIDDVTEQRRELEQARLLAQEQAARAEAEAANRAKDEFVAMLAHELRNPLAPLRNALHILRLQTRPGSEALPTLDLAERQVRHMARMLEDLLDVARISRGRIALRKQPLDLVRAVMGAADSVRRKAEAAGHVLEVIPPPQPVWVEADPVRLEQVFINLLYNAIKYTPRGGHITFSAAIENGQPGLLPSAVVRVKDTGIGIAPELVPKVFELFTQADRSLDRAQGGLGIGLTLVKRLVELHGGSVGAFSAGVGQGSEFVVRLPAHHGAAPASVASAVTATTVAKPTPLRVVVVDDNADAAESMATVLRAGGHEVHTALDGASALHLVQSNYSPHVVLLDIGLPGMDGFEVGRQLRQQAGMEKAVLVAVTGYGSDEDRRRSQEAGFDYHLVKPVDLAALERLLTTVGTRFRA